MVGLFVSAETSATRIAVMGGSVTHNPVGAVSNGQKSRGSGQEQD